MFYQVQKDAAWSQRKRLERIDKITWILFGILEFSLFLRLIMNLVSPDSNSTAGTFVHSITGVIIAPFGILFGVSSFRYSMFEMVTLLAMAVYAIAFWIILNVNGAKMAAITLNYEKSGILPTTFPSRPSLEMVKIDDVSDEDDEDQFSA